MARPLTADGKRVTVCAKVSEAQASAMDTARGTLTRSAWVASLIAAALDTGKPERRGIPAKQPARASKPATTRAAPAAADLDPSPRKPGKCCDRPDIMKGTCRRCKTFVGYGS